MNEKNEILKLKRMMNEALNAAHNQKPEPSKYGDIPPNIFSEFQRKRKQLQDEEDNKT